MLIPPKIPVSGISRAYDAVSRAQLRWGVWGASLADFTGPGWEQEDDVTLFTLD